MAGDKHKHLLRWGQLKSERASWVPHWTELSRHFQPRLGRFFVTDRNRGQKRHNAIYDSSGTRALRVLAAGMMAGMTSPARPWFRLTTADQDLAESANVRVWLSDVTRLMLDVYQRSNAYRAFQGIYEELGCFGTAASIVLPNFQNVQHHYPSTIGEYAISTDYEGRVNTFYREFQMTVAQMVGQFGIDKVSRTVKTIYDRGNLDTWITVYHSIQPRSDRDSEYPDAKNMPWESCYFEIASDEGQYLSESGFKSFRVLAPRWHAVGGDIYGYSPGMEALGDVKQLQHQQLRKAQAIDYQTKPPIGLPTSAKGSEADLIPGGITYFDMATPTAGARTMFEAKLDLNALLQDIGDVRGRINAAFYADLFLMLSQQPVNSNMTATEVAERHEEKLMVLGPVLERLHDEMLDPLVHLTFTDLLEAGALPPPPPEMRDAALNIEFVSMLAQAQRAIGTASTDRFVSNLGVVAQMGKPEVLDKFDADAWADAYADDLGVDPRLIVPDQKVALIRQARAKQQQQQEAMDQAERAAGAAKNAAAAPTKGGQSNALNDVMNLFSGYTSPSAEQYG